MGDIKFTYKYFDLLERDLDAFDSLRKRQLPAKLSFSLARVTTAVKEEFDAYLEQKIKFIHEYAERDKNGDPVVENNGRMFKIDKQKINEFREEFSDLLATEISLGLDKVPVDFDWLERKGVSLSQAEITLLLPLITEQQTKGVIKK